MTLIASTLNYKMPIMISDLLGTDKTDSPIPLPASGDRYIPFLPENEPDRPVRLAQKMYITKKACVLFAGIGLEIIPFLTLFRKYFENKKITVDDIHAFLKAYHLGHNYIQSAFLILFFKDVSPRRKIVGQFYWPGTEHVIDNAKFDYLNGAWNILKEPLFEQTSACGTGAKDFLEIVRQPVTMNSHFIEGDFRRALQANTGLIVKLLAKERTDFKSLASHWGGGFELSYYNGKSFEKVGDIAYVIFHGQFDEHGDIGIPIPMLIMYYRYVGEILYITTIEVYKYQVEETNTAFIYTTTKGQFKTWIYEVEPLDLEDINAIPMPTDFSYTTGRIAFGYSIRKQYPTADGKAVEKQLDFYPSGFNEGWELTIEFKQRQSLVLTMDKGIAKDIGDMCRARFPFL